MAGKSEQTRQLVADVALRMFREIGFEKTTMRAIAAEAGVSVGNAYYYFASKDDLVHELYLQIQAEHAGKAAEAVIGVKDLSGRLKATMLAGLDVMAPYHRFGADFIATAIRPTSPVNPFNAHSAAARETSLAIFREVVDGASSAAPRKLRAELPELLWLGYMGVTLFWVYDGSEGQLRTRKLVNGLARSLPAGCRSRGYPGSAKSWTTPWTLSRSVRG